MFQLTKCLVLPPCDEERNGADTAQGQDIKEFHNERRNTMRISKVVSIHVRGLDTPLKTIAAHNNENDIYTSDCRIEIIFSYLDARDDYLDVNNTVETVKLQWAVEKAQRGPQEQRATVDAPSNRGRVCAARHKCSDGRRVDNTQECSDESRKYRRRNQQEK
jgi:hypothetical protein